MAITARMTIGQRFGIWLQLIRLPFLVNVVAPFVLGSVLAWRLTGVFDFVNFILGTIAAALIAAAANTMGEVFDIEGDAIGEKTRNKFSGGTLLVYRGVVTKTEVFTGGVLLVVTAAFLGFVICFIRGAGWVPLVLGAFGVISGFFYSTTPVAWGSRGVGEILIAICYGWLAVAAAYFIQAGNLVPAVHWLSLPASLSIMGVIYINQFPDYPADKAVGRRNWVVRLGPARAAPVYGVISLLTAASLPIAVWQGGLSYWACLLILPVSLLALLNGFLIVVKRAWDDRTALEKACGNQILINLGSSALLTFAVLLFY
jgi:1,4-dihydroxy-2-naphthoate octaprenyltransferase